MPPNRPGYNLVVSAENKPFWSYCSKHELRLQSCSDCGTLRYPLFGARFNCLSENFWWRKLSGRGTVTSLIVYHRAFPWVEQEYTRKIPYNVVEVSLDEGPRIPSNVAGAPPECKAEIGMRVSVFFEDRRYGLSVPMFRASSTSEGSRGRTNRRHGATRHRDI